MILKYSNFSYSIEQLKDANIDYVNLKNIAKNWITLQDIINLNNKLNFLKTHNGNFNIE